MRYPENILFWQTMRQLPHAHRNIPYLILQPTIQILYVWKGWPAGNRKYTNEWPGTVWIVRWIILDNTKKFWYLTPVVTYHIQKKQPVWYDFSDWIFGTLKKNVNKPDPGCLLIINGCWQYFNRNLLYNFNQWQALVDRGATVPRKHTPGSPA